MAIADDVRRTPREVVDQYMRVFRTDTGELVGYLADISIYGLMLQSQSPLMLSDGEERVALRLELDTPIDKASELTFEARPVWSRKEGSSVFHHTGLEFVELPEDDQRRVQTLMETYRLTTV
ncbi:PilZ domain-containing protein [Aquisalimonas asiatica]|uniref:PilZ domain-containing protein n=1 Tax=Aquisalimonas asiatica TaxID=406100 RepID=A0A1H8UVG7_9GAMM|nr:PilZ domain-containing protein [Aquisalimonas asiatica]SEP07179.1 PilZ domain-containing protein [Aquisalimonas asiatica]